MLAPLLQQNLCTQKPGLQLHLPAWEFALMAIQRCQRGFGVMIAVPLGECRRERPTFRLDGFHRPACRGNAKGHAWHGVDGRCSDGLGLDDWTASWIAPRSLGSVRRPALRGDARLKLRAASEPDLALREAIGARPEGRKGCACREVSTEDGIAIAAGGVVGRFTPAGATATDGTRECCLRRPGVSVVGLRLWAVKRAPMSGRRERSTT